MGQGNRGQDRALGAAPWMRSRPPAYLRWAQRSKTKLSPPHFQSPPLGIYTATPTGDTDQAQFQFPDLF